MLAQRISFQQFQSLLNPQSVRLFLQSASTAMSLSNMWKSSGVTSQPITASAQCCTVLSSLKLSISQFSFIYFLLSNIIHQLRHRSALPPCCSSWTEQGTGRVDGFIHFMFLSNVSDNQKTPESSFLSFKNLQSLIQQESGGKLFPKMIHSAAQSQDLFTKFRCLTSWIRLCPLRINFRVFRQTVWSCNSFI